MNSPINTMHGPLIRSSLGGGVLSVSLAGEFDHYSCLPLRALLDEGAALGARRLVLDAALVTFCDSALAHVLDRWAGGGRSWELASDSRPVRLLLDLWARVGRRQGGGASSCGRRPDAQAWASLPRSGCR
ncbi:STAS domain-containing protein [Streptomyces sp. NPDC029216]|uniref:STAS domain-containing protein n=1 Tax=Streptomyces sp. NPDC029216 TaxID=3154701 RepID=UPI00340CB77C